MTFSDDIPTAHEEVSGQHRQVGADRRPRDGSGTDSEQLLQRAADMIASARPMPLSASVMINKDEVLDLLGEALDRLPDELKSARWLLKEREEFLAKAQAEAAEILDAARARAELMVQRTEVVKASEKKARRILTHAEDESRRIRHECEDFCDQKLASFEIVLERIQRMVQNGREKLQGPLLAAVDQVQADEEDDDPGFFDQDQE